MASLTPLSKGLIGLAVLGGMASAVWHLYLKERMTTGSAPPPAASAPMQQPPAVPTALPPVVRTPVEAPPPVPVATPTEPVRPPPAAPLVVPPKANNANNTKANGLSASENAETGRRLLANNDFAAARSHLEQAVKDGDAAAACLLGEMTLKGQGGIPASQDKAAALFQLAQSRNVICFTVGK